MQKLKSILRTVKNRLNLGDSGLCSPLRIYGMCVCEVNSNEYSAGGFFKVEFSKTNVSQIAQIEINQRELYQFGWIKHGSNLFRNIKHILIQG